MSDKPCTCYAGAGAPVRPSDCPKHGVNEHTRWCVHIRGPDDLYPMRSKEDAERVAREHDAAMEIFLANTPHASSPHFPARESLMAVVVEWPHGPRDDEAWEQLCKEAETP